MLANEISFNIQYPLLKASEVAKILSISRAKAYQLLNSGHIPIVRIDHSVRVRREDLQNYLKINWIGPE